MIGRLKGKLIEKSPPFLLVDVQGVGYEVQAPMTSIYPLPAIGEMVVLHTHLSVSENAHLLFAFYTQDERRLFRALIKVNGVGPKMALAILSGISVEEFIRSISAGHSDVLVKVPGVGKKTAERLIIEMQDRLKDWELPESSQLSQTVSSNMLTNTITTDAEGALIALGYKPVEASKVIAQVMKTEQPATSEDLIRLSLQVMGGAR